MSLPNPPIEDREAFLQDVEEFMKQRGVPFDRDAKASGRPIDLHDLYRTVLAHGGYDKLSGERMAWRMLVKDYNLPSQHEPAMTFQLKSVYYKNLAAYEIARAWEEEPPPKEILEDLTAKGGDLRNRRLENYTVNSRPTGIDTMSNDDDSEPRRTPSRDGQVEEPTSGNRYPSRQLRQDPKRTQVYQPEHTPSRPRSNYGRMNSPHASPAPTQHYANATTDPRHPSFTVDKYEPQQPMTLTLRPLHTPGSNPDVFFRHKAMKQAQALPRIQPDPNHLDQLKFSLAPAVLQGPNIYNRCHLGLMSGIKGEEDFALHHLVKVSDERGDKFTFSGFPYLAEALLEKCLQISDVVYGMRWKISYDQAAGVVTPQTLNASYGTPYLREQVASLQPIEYALDVKNQFLSDRLERLNEAALVIRNMITLDANALFISKLGIFKDFLIIAINLPQQSRLVEFKQYVLEMAEHATRHWNLGPSDELYLSLLDGLQSGDRATLMSALRAITRIGAETEQVFKISHVPRSTIERLFALVLLDDDELVELALELLYEYTAMDENVTLVLQQDPSLLLGIMPKLTGMLTQNATTHEEKIQNRMFPSRNQLGATIPRVPHELFTSLLQYAEPERSSRWLRCCFQESAEDDITQIAIWQAYSAVFETARPIPAAEFIKNVSSTFTQAQAQVISGPTPRFIIKGIKARRVLIDPQGRTFFKCLWSESLRPNDPAFEVFDGSGQKRHVCGQWHGSRQRLWFHIMAEHLKVSHDSTGKLLTAATSTSVPTIDGAQNSMALTNGDSTSQPAATSVEQQTYRCLWATCSRIHALSGTKAIGIHVRGHIPETSDAMAKMLNDLAIVPDTNRPYKPNEDPEDMYTRHSFFYTSVDERGQPCGIPFFAVMIMRNLARYVARCGATIDLPSYLTTEMPPSPPAKSVDYTEGQSHTSNHNNEAPNKDARKRQALMSRIFNMSIRNQLFHMLSVQRTLAHLLVDLLGLIEKGEKGERKRKIEDFEREPPHLGGELGYVGGLQGAPV